MMFAFGCLWKSLTWSTYMYIGLWGYIYTQLQKQLHTLCTIFCRGGRNVCITFTHGMNESLVRCICVAFVARSLCKGGPLLQILQEKFISPRGSRPLDLAGAWWGIAPHAAMPLQGTCLLYDGCACNARGTTFATWDWPRSRSVLLWHMRWNSKSHIIIG